MDLKFKLNGNNDEVDLSKFKGKKVVLYFYPKDNTKKCTTEALEFSELKTEFEKENTVVFGVSKDSVESHKKFIEKNSITVDLLSDPDGEIHDKFKVIGTKVMCGRESIGTIRSTFVFDEKGKLIKEFRNVKSKNHAKTVLNFIKEYEV